MRRLFCSLWLFVVSITTAFATTPTPTLTIYSYDSFFSDWGPGPELIEAFKSQCQCQIKVIALADAGLLLTRLKLEGEHNQADVIIGLDNQQRIQPFVRHLVTFLPNDLPTPQLPLTWQDKSFMPLDWSWFAFVYDDRRIGKIPQSFAMLANGKYRIVIEDPRTSTPGLGLLVWIKALYGEQADDYWQALQANLVTITPSWVQAYGLMLQGEADLVLSYTTSPVFHLMIQHNPHYHAAIFDEGHLLQIETAAISRNSRQPQLAARFIRFLASPAAQQQIMQHNWMYPAFATNKAWPLAFQTLAKPNKTLSLDENVLLKKLPLWLNQWQRTLSH